MEKPRWITIVGILGIVFGGMGIFGAIGEIAAPHLKKFQKTMLIESQKSIQDEQEKLKKENKDDPQLKNVEEINSKFLNIIEKINDTPEWYDKVWTVISGITKACVSILYLISSILLLTIKKPGIRLFYWAASSSIVYCTVKVFVIFAAFSTMGAILQLIGCFGLLIDIALIIVVAKGDKTIFSLKKGTLVSTIE